MGDAPLTFAARASRARADIQLHLKGLDDQRAIILEALLAMGPLGGAVANLPPAKPEKNDPSRSDGGVRAESTFREEVAADFDHAVRQAARLVGLPLPSPYEIKAKPGG